METNLTKAAKSTADKSEKMVNQAADSLAEKFKDGAKAVSKKTEQAESAFPVSFADIKERAADGYEEALEVIKKYPLYSFLGAAAVGLLASSLIKRAGRS